MPRKFKDHYEDTLPDELPMDVMPCSNEEYIPPEPTKLQKTFMSKAMEACDREAKKHGMSRRRFLQTSAAYAVCMGVFNDLVGRRQYAFGRDSDTTAACDLAFADAQMNNRDGEFIIDCQTHHVDSGGEWRLRNPGTMAFMTVGFSQAQPWAGCGETDPVECLGRYHYFKEVFLDSSTNIGILSTLPYKDDDGEPPNGQALPFREAIETARMVERIDESGSDGSEGPIGLNAGRRIYVHKFVMPNRGSAGSRSDGAIGKGAYAQPPLLWEREKELMREAVENHGLFAKEDYLRAWKTYTPWGEVPYTTGWWLDDPVGLRFIEYSLDLVPLGFNPLICVHKGFALPAFDQEKAATRDVGVVASRYWWYQNGQDPVEDGDGMNFMIYHSGFDGDPEGLSLSLAFPPTNQGTSAQSPYYLDFDQSGEIGLGIGSESDERVRSIDRGVDNFIKSLRENGWSARHFAPGGTPRLPGIAGDGDRIVHANVPNVYAELGAVWSNVTGGGTHTFTYKGNEVEIDGPSFLLGKLIYYVGPKRITWGTDSLWFGSPQDVINRFRTHQMHPVIKELYNLPWGLEGDADDPTVDTRDGTNYGDGIPHPERSIRNAILGRNAAHVYGVDVNATIRKIECGNVQKIRDQYLINPIASHEKFGPRTRRELLSSIRKDPWHRGIIRDQNDWIRQGRPIVVGKSFRG